MMSECLVILQCVFYSEHRLQGDVGREKSVGIFSELYSHPFMKLTVVMYCC